MSKQNNMYIQNKQNPGGLDPWPKRNKLKIYLQLSLNSLLYEHDPQRMLP